MLTMVSRKKGLLPLTIWLLGSWIWACVANAQVQQVNPQGTSDRRGDRPPEAVLADRAFWMSRSAQGIEQLRQTWTPPTHWSLPRKNFTDQQRAFLMKVAKDWETQLRFESAVAALKLHYGIAACTMGLQIQSQTEAYLSEQIAVEKEWIESGGQIDDTTLLERTSLELKDQRVELETKRVQLQEELSLIAGSEIACSYTARLVCVPTPELLERCDYERWSMEQRIELQVLQAILRNLEAIDQETISMVGSLISLPTSIRNLWSMPERPRFLAHQSRSDLLSARRSALETWIESRVQGIRFDVGQAYRAKEASWKRWQLAVEKSDLLGDRIEQLRELSELKGNLPQQIQAKLEHYQAQASEIQRWLQWHLDDCDLQQAAGRIGYWNLDPNPYVERANYLNLEKAP